VADYRIEFALVRPEKMESELGAVSIGVGIDFDFDEAVVRRSLPIEEDIQLRMKVLPNQKRLIQGN